MISRNYIFRVFLFVFFLQSCTTSTWISPKNSPIMLSTDTKNCQVVSQHRIWMLLFGTWHINPLNLTSAIKNKKSSYRITEKRDWLDLLVTIGGGWLISLTSKTWLFESCDMNYFIETKIDRSNNTNKALVNYSKSRGKPIQVHTNDDTFIGKLVEINQKAWLLEVEDESNTQANSLDDVLILKSGKKVYGKVINQSVNSVRFRSRLSTKRYLKSRIQKLEFAKTSDEGKTILIKKVPVAEITKVIFD